MKYIVLLVAATVFLAANNRCVSAEPTPLPADSGKPVPSIASRDRSTVSILDGRGRTVLRYRYAGFPMKPYVVRLHSPGGVQVLRDSPHDHKHHHGLMFALAVDGVDFWGEAGKENGKQMQREIGEVKTAAQNGLRRTEFTQELNWIGPESDRPLLIESRTIGEYRSSDLGATLIEWRGRLQTPPGRESAELTGHHYFGLGMRFVESMDRTGRFFNSDDRLGEIVRGDERLTPVKWCAYAAKVDGKPVTIALFDHPSNLRHPAKMFTMTKKFAYMSATLNVWKKPLALTPDRPLELRYGIAVWDGFTDKKAVEQLYKRWCDISP